MNTEKVSGQDVAHAIKKRIMLKSVRVQYLELTLLETCVKDYEKILRDTCRKLGFVSDDVGLDADKCKVLMNLEA